MPDILLDTVGFSGYISVVKFVIFLVLFFPWIWLVCWVHDDAKAVGTNESTWATIVLLAGAVGAMLCLLIPVFFVGLLLFLIAVAASSLSYVMHRNALVPEFEKVLTADHIMGLFANDDKKRQDLEKLGFISANDNEIPVPEPKTPEFFGFKTAHDLFSDALYRRASNIIFTPRQNAYKVSYIVDGATLEQPDMTKSVVKTLSNLLKQLADMDMEEKRKPQKGIFRIRQEEGSSQWEVATAGSTVGEQIRIKQITQDTVMRLSEIDLLPDQYEQMEAVCSMKQGLFLISGPKQSGVTTTFYAFIRNHDAFLNSISTLELNPTAELPNVTQEVFSLSNSGTTTYARKLMSIVRMSPDVLGVVDIKDAETAKVACQAAKEGALVYATIEADSVINAIGRWMKLVGDRRIIAETIVGAGNQRLFRKLCPECKQAYEPNKELVRKFNIPPAKAKVLHRAGKVVYDKRGKAFPCGTCHEIGFFGRTCVFETIVMNKELRMAVYQAKSMQDLSMQFRKAKMKYLQEQMLERVLEGTTSINEMIRVLSGPKQAKPPRPTSKG